MRCGAAPAAPAASGEGQHHAALTAPGRRRRHCGSRPPPARPFPGRRSPRSRTLHTHPPPRSLAVGTVLAERPPCGQSQRALGAVPPTLRVGGTTGLLLPALFNPFIPTPAALHSTGTVGGFLQACLHKTSFWLLSYLHFSFPVVFQIAFSSDEINFFFLSPFYLDFSLEILPKAGAIPRLGSLASFG